VSRAGFAGYRTDVSRVKDLSASWRVPTIVKGGDSHYSDAATWIAVQNDKGYFMQIGTLEHATVPDVFGTPPPGTFSYAAFFSDTALNFAPEILGVVHGGDLVSVDLEATVAGWQAHLYDETTASTFGGTTPYGKGQVFTQVQWSQEDPVQSGQPNVNVVYPDIQDTNFSNVVVNGHVPFLSRSDALATDVVGQPGPDLRPTPLQSDSFQIMPVTGVQRQYLNDIAWLDQFRGM
jgi:hypothetical protein